MISNEDFKYAIEYFIERSLVSKTINVSLLNGDTKTISISSTDAPNDFVFIREDATVEEFDKLYQKALLMFKGDDAVVKYYKQREIAINLERFRWEDGADEREREALLRQHFEEF